MSKTTIKRSVGYITEGIIFLTSTLPESETLGINQDLCRDATPGDLLEITLEEKTVVGAKVLEVREPRDTTGHI